MSLDPQRGDMPNDGTGLVSNNGANRVVLMVADHQEVAPQLRHIVELRGYCFVDTDNGQDAARRARQTLPELLVVDMDVPLLYELVAARQIVKHAQVGPMPVVIVTHQDLVDPAQMMEVVVSRDEYIMRHSAGQELQHLLDYLLPVLPPVPNRISVSLPAPGQDLIREMGSD